MTSEFGVWTRTMTSTMSDDVTQFLVGWEAALVGGDPDQRLEELGRVMDEMLGCDELIDPTLEQDTLNQTVRFEVIVEAEDALDAMGKATSLVRACLHGTGVGTPSWPTARDIERSSLRLRFEQDPSIEQLAEA